MQVPQHKNLLKLETTPESSLKDSGQEQEDKISRVKDPPKQRKNSERRTTHRHYRDDFINLRRNHEVGVVVQIDGEDLDVKNCQCRHLAQQQTSRIRKKIGDPSGQREVGQTELN